MVSRHQIQSLADEIAAKFAVERIVLFGSHAYGQPTADSDVDLLVLMEFEGRSFEQAVAIRLAVRPAFAWDLLVRAPVDPRRQQGFDLVVREALREGQVLYERNRARVAG